MSDLKKRLREGNHLYAVADEAADRIEELEATVEALMDLAGHAYIFCGVHDAPEQWLDVMLAGAGGEDFTTEGLLPYTPQPQGDASPQDRLKSYDDGSVDYARNTAYRWLDERDRRVAGKTPTPQVSGGVEVDEEMVKRFKSAYEMAREADDTQDTALRDGLKAVLSTPQVPGGGERMSPHMAKLWLNELLEECDSTLHEYAYNEILSALSTPQTRPDGGAVVAGELVAALIDISEHGIDKDGDRNFTAEGHQKCVGLAYAAIEQNEWFFGGRPHPAPAPDVARGEDQSSAWESWHMAYLDAAEIVSNSTDQRIVSRASRVVTWLKKHEPKAATPQEADK